MGVRLGPHDAMRGLAGVGGEGVVIGPLGDKEFDMVVAGTEDSLKQRHTREALTAQRWAMMWPSLLSDP